MPITSGASRAASSTSSRPAHGDLRTGASGRYVKCFEDKSAKQQYEQYHAQGSTCLPSTSEGQHPALVLIGQKGLSCKVVCQGRLDGTLEALTQIKESKFTLDMASVDKNDDGRVDQSEFKTMLLLAAKNRVAGSGIELTDEIADLLLQFVPLDKDSLVAHEPVVLKAKVRLALVLWFLVCKNGSEWKSKLRLPLRKERLLETLTALNQGERVEMRESVWIREKFRSIQCSPEVESIKMLLCVAYWYSAPQARSHCGLSRRQMIQRTALERKLWEGLCRFALWTGVFGFFAASLIQMNEAERCRGIRGNLVTQLNLDDTSKVTTMREVNSYVKEFSKLSANLAPLSRVYFGGGNVWSIQDALRVFQAPVALPSLMEPDPNDAGAAPIPWDLGSSFTLQAWVQFTGRALPPNGVSLLRKALPRFQGGTSELSCWNWRFPPALSYGAHDYGAAGPNNSTGLMEDYVGAPYPPDRRLEDARSVLHSLIVTPTTVTFMVDDRILVQQALPRPFTDCKSQDLFLGDDGLTLASVRFYPRSLSVREVGQIFSTGSMWKDIGQVIVPQRLKGMSETGTMGQDLMGKVDEAKASTVLAEEAAWASAALSSNSQSVGQKDVPYVNAHHPIPRRPADPTLGHPYWEVYSKPVYLDATSKNLAPSPALPPAPGRSGFTVSAWLKIDSVVGHGYFMALAMPLFSNNSVTAGTTSDPIWSGWSNQCWMIYVGMSYTGLYTRSGAAGSQVDGPTYFVDDLKLPPEWRFVGKAYRHFVFQIVPQDTKRPLRVCIDGVCTGDAVIDASAALTNVSFPPAASCEQTGIMQSYSSAYSQQVANMSRLYLNRRPLDSFPMTAWAMQTKYFDRVLTASEIRKLFNKDPDPSDVGGRPIRQTRGCKLPSELKDDRLFRDPLGNNCYWYFKNRISYPAVCNNAEVLRACPVSCQLETCFGAKGGAGKSLQIWDHQMEFRTRGAFGTMCVAKSTTPEAEAIKCGLHAPNHANCHALKAVGQPLDCGPRDCSAFASDRAKLVQCLGKTRWVPDSGHRYDYFVPCKDIVLLNMPSCAWDDSGLDAVAHDINASQTWSISFWFEGLSGSACNQPTVRLLDGDGGTFSWVGAMGKIAEDVSAGRGWLPGCGSDPWLSHGLINSRAEGDRGGDSGSLSADVGALTMTPGIKHFAILGRKADGSTGLNLDEQENFQARDLEELKSLAADRNFLRVINVQGNARMSPLTLRSFYPTSGDIGILRFSQQVDQDRRIGPHVPLQDQLKRRIVRSINSYAQKTMMLAPPLLLQKRSQSGECESTFSQDIVVSLHKQGQDSQCSAPYLCPNYEPRNIYTCALDKDDESEHFGHPPVKFEYGTYHMEYLASIADNAVLVRTQSINGHSNVAVRKTDEYLDLLTNEVDILALFYSVEFGITSLLRVSFDTRKGRVRVNYYVQHFVAVTGSPKAFVVSMLIAALVFVFIIIVDIIPFTLQQIHMYRAFKRVHVSSLLETVADTLLGVVTFVLILMQLMHSVHATETMQDLVLSLANFDWNLASGTQDLTVVKQLFADQISKVQLEINSKENMTNIHTLLCIGLLIRMVLCTSAHPRIELITGTIKEAASDLFHFFGLMLVIFFGFSILGHLLFGAEDEAFNSVTMTFGTLFDSVLGPPGLLSVQESFALTEPNVKIIYVILFHALCFLFMLNFVLAIIVDSYTKVMQRVRDCIIDQNILLDVASIIQYQYLLFKYNLPSRRVVQSYLADLDTKVITLDDLFGDDSGDNVRIFPTPEAADAFFRHYMQYDFLMGEAEMPDEPTMSDLAMITALTMHKVETLQHKLDDDQTEKAHGSTPVCRQPSSPRMIAEAAEPSGAGGQQGGQESGRAAGSPWPWPFARDREAKRGSSSSDLPPDAV